jgi:hypothetical protein
MSSYSARASLDAAVLSVSESGVELLPSPSEGEHLAPQGRQSHADRNRIGDVLQ